MTQEDKELLLKVYLQENTTTDCYGEFWPEWFEARAKDSDIEYTRTDAFIEKATLWLRTNASDYCILHNSYDTEELVKDFVNAMKRD